MKNHIITFFIFLFIFTKKSYAVWGDTVHFPKFSHVKDSIASLKIDAPEHDKLHFYAKTGVFFPKGSISKAEHLTAQDTEGNKYPVQLDVFNKYKDGSIRFGVVTLETKNISKNQSIEINLFNDPNQPKANKISLDKNILPNISLHIKDSKGRQKIVSLKDATAEKTPWQSGNLLYSNKYSQEIFKDLHVDFNIDFFRNQQTKIDIIMHYDRLYETPMRDIIYDLEVKINNKTYKKKTNIKHAHHTKWRLPIRFGYTQDNVVLLNMHQLKNLNVIPNLDLSFGTSKNQIQRNYENTLHRNYTSLDGTGLLTPAMGTTGARAEIALLPQWASQYVMSGDKYARYTTLAHGEIAAHIPWHYYDYKTNSPAIGPNHPNVWIDSRATLSKHNIHPLKETTQWKIDVAHQPSLVYLPFIITGDRYFYDTLKSIYMYNRLAYDPEYTLKNNDREMLLEQVRSNGWFRRAAGEMHSILNTQKDLDASYIQSRNQKDTNFFYENFILGKAYGAKKGQQYSKAHNSKITGELVGMFAGYIGPENPLFMQDLAALGISFEAGLGLVPWYKELSLWQSQFISGRFLQKHNGYSPKYGAIYKFYQMIPDENGYPLLNGKFHILSKWRDVFNYSMENYDVFKQGKLKVENGDLPGYHRSAETFTAYARASNAQLFNVTRNPHTLEAYGFLAQYFADAASEYFKFPAYMIAPRFNDRVSLRYDRIKIGSSFSNDLTNEKNYSLIHGGEGDDTIGLEANALSGFLFGGEGNDVIYAGSPDDFTQFHQKPSNIREGSYIFGGDGEDIIISIGGHNTLKGDENHMSQKDTFVYHINSRSQDTILDFNPKRDLINVCGQGAQDLSISDFTYKQHTHYVTMSLKNMKLNLRGVQFKDLSSQNFVFDRCVI